MAIIKQKNEDVKRAERKFRMIRDDAVKPPKQKKLFNEILRR